MTCVICKNGELQPGHTTVSLDRGATTVVFKEVPAEVCDNCGEYYLDAPTTDRVLARAQAVAAAGHDVEVIRYAA